jgi:hypothetical protein
MKAKSTEERGRFGKAGDALRSPDRIRKLAGRIYRQFER